MNRRYVSFTPRASSRAVGVASARIQMSPTATRRPTHSHVATRARAGRAHGDALARDDDGAHKKMVVTHTTARRARDDVARDGPTDDARIVANALRAATTNHRADARAHRRKRFAADSTTTKNTILATDRVDASSSTRVAHLRVPTDWTLKSSARLSSATSFRWMARAGARATADGLRAYAGGESFEDDGDDDKDTGDRSSSMEATHRAMVRASYSCAYPASPMTEAQATTMAATASGAAWMRERASMWVDALVSLYGLLRAGRCHAFYVVYTTRTILFCAPGVGGAAGGFAVATNGDAKLRRALHDASVDFTSADEEALAIDRARAARARPWRAEDEEEHVEEAEEGRLLDGLAGGDASRAGAVVAAADAPGASRRRAADTIVCRGAIAVSGLVNVLIDAEGGDPGCSDASARDVPTLLAPVPFAHGCMRPVKFFPRTNATTTHGGETHHGEKEQPSGFHALAGPSSNATTMRATYSAETGRDELIPPWTLERVCAAAATRHDAFTVACSPHLATRGLNVGVLAAKDMFGARNATNAMERRAYYDREETEAIATAPSAASVLRVEYSGGKYYIP